MSEFAMARATRARVQKRSRARRRAWASWALALASLTVQAQAQAQAGPVLSLARAQALALERSQALPARLAAAQAAHERALAAQRRPDPVLRLGLDNVPVEGGSDSLLTREPTTARSIGIVQAWPAAAKRAARSDVFLREAEVARAEGDAEARALWQASGLAWLGLRAEQQRLATLELQLVQAGRLHEAAEAAYRAGSGSQADVFAARAAQALLADERLHVQLQLEQARTTLQRWVGDAAAAPLAEGTDERGELGESSTTAASWAALPAAELALADAELQVATAQHAVAGAAAAAAREDRHADWSVDLRFQQRGPRFDNMVSLGLSIPLRWGDHTAQDRELAARLAQQRAAEARREEVLRARVAEVQRWQQRWHSGQARLRLHDEQRAPLAQAQVQAALGAYRAGQGSLAAVLAAQQAELGLQLQRVQLALATASDGLRLQSLTAAVFTPPTSISAHQEQQP